MMTTEEAISISNDLEWKHNIDVLQEAKLVLEDEGMTEFLLALELKIMYYYMNDDNGDGDISST